MEAKDTVMSDEQLDKLGWGLRGQPHCTRDVMRLIAEQQAEISFNKGYIKGTEESTEKYRDIGRQEGRREKEELTTQQTDAVFTLLPEYLKEAGYVKLAASLQG